jgi:hypothetical protein
VEKALPKLQLKKVLLVLLKTSALLHVLAFLPVLRALSLKPRL